MRAAGVVLATAVALAIQTTLGRFVVRGTLGVDLVLVVVIYSALAHGSVAGLLAGTFAGLVQDALSSGVVGIGGLAKTIVGFLTGIASTQFIVQRPMPRFVVFFMATVLHQLVFMGLYVLLGLRELDNPYRTVLGQAAANGAIGVLAFEITELLPGAIERRRLTRTKLRR